MLFELLSCLALVMLALAIIVLTCLKIHKAKKRQQYLLNKYQDHALVDAIINRSFWQGQSAEQLRDSLGPPLQIEKKRLRDKTQEVWTYKYRIGHRYMLSITLDNGHVIFWNKKVRAAA